MRKTLVLAPCTALLFACGGGGSSVSLQPGQWETTMQFSNIEAPGAPEAQVAQMRAMMGRPQTRSECITAAQAANPMGNMMNPGGTGCNFTQNTFSGGTINLQGSCNPPGGQATAAITMTGTFTADTITANVSSEVRPTAATPGAPQSIRMSGTLTSRRTGECPGGAR
jgi:Protein of unknown function (DUF3617)